MYIYTYIYIHTHTNIYIYIYIYIYDVMAYTYILHHEGLCPYYRVATISRLLEIIGLFCKRAL